MKIQFFQPFDELSGKREIHLNLARPIPVRKLLAILGERIPSFKSYLRQEEEEVMNFFVVLVRGDEILKLEDPVGDRDVIKILPPISGG